MNDAENAEERLAKRLEALEQRVAELEKRTNAQASFPSSPWTSAASTDAPVSATHGASLLALLGQAMLAIAGAYLLRAATTSKVLPQIPLATLAIVYAFAWLIPGARTKAQTALPSVIWSGTSVLIFLPMIWEMTLRFRILPDGLAASLLALYVIAAAGLGWKRHFADMAWITVGTASLAVLALAVATHDLVPFISALLVIAAVGEVAVAGQQKLPVRPLVAALADGAIFALVWIYSSPAASRSVYPAVPSFLLLILAPLLLCLYAASASTQIVLRRRGISIFETVETLLAFVLTCWSFLSFWSGEAAIVLGVLCLVASAAGYAVCFGWFRRIQAQRNFHVYATGSLALLLTGCFLSLPSFWVAVVLGVFAVGMSFAAARMRVLSLGFHGLAALVVMAAASGQLLWSARVFSGALPGVPDGAILLVAASAVCFSVVLLASSLESRGSHLLRFSSAALGVWASAGFLVWGLARIGAHLWGPPSSVAGSELVAVVRTVVACGFAVGLAWSGGMWQRRELAWLAWPVLVLTAFKILLEDLGSGHLAWTAVSIFIYALTLLAVSQMIRPKAGARSDGSGENRDSGRDGDRT